MVIRTPRGVRVWARAAPTDLGKGFAGLAGLVEAELGHDLVAGNLFVFRSPRRRLVKVLRWDGTGLYLYGGRLARGGQSVVGRGDRDRIVVTGALATSHGWTSTSFWTQVTTLHKWRRRSIYRLMLTNLNIHLSPRYRRYPAYPSQVDPCWH
jgi:hypothetical protein